MPTSLPLHTVIIFIAALVFVYSILDLQKIWNGNQNHRMRKMLRQNQSYANCFSSAALKQINNAQFSTFPVADTIYWLVCNDIVFTNFVNLPLPYNPSHKFVRGINRLIYRTELN